MLVDSYSEPENSHLQADCTLDMIKVEVVETGPQRLRTVTDEAASIDKQMLDTVQ
jgi:hypothetical protein